MYKRHKSYVTTYTFHIVKMFVSLSVTHHLKETTVVCGEDRRQRIVLRIRERYKRQ